MKKLVALLLGSAMVATSVMGLVACNKQPTEKPGEDHTEHVDADNNGKCDVCGEDMGTPGPGPGPDDDVVYADRRVDPRAVDAYEAYDYEGNKVGTFKTVADAINATVEADLDFMEEEDTADGAKGGYVLKKGGTRHLFDNTKGYGSGNSDVFWYYENGSALTAYNCWDANNSIATLHNSKVIAHETTSMGLQSVQTWNGYGLLDENGNEIDSSVAMPQSYELSSAMDASILMFTGESKGVGGLKYVIDLSEVQITPAYEGFEDKVYAFIGIYAWQGYYVVANGIACDTETGDWYEYRGTSRDDSFSDVEYNRGKKIMSSTWTQVSDTKGDGYWTPNAKEMELEIKTTRQHDDFEDEDYFEDVYTIKLDGKVAFNTAIGADTVNELFSGAAYNVDNTYVFTAGLDIKNNIATGVRVNNADFFNGAKFLNLAVTEAYVYFPTQEEISDAEAGMIINEKWRGKYMDVLLANDESANGAYAYTILQTYACTSYKAVDGADCYSFRYDGSPVSDSELGGQLKVYQDAIDSLANMTIENINEYLDTYFEVGTWYGDDATHTGSVLLQQYLNLLDFAPYVAAEQVYKDSLNLSEEATKILEDLGKLSTITAYGTATGTKYLGWKAPEGTTDVTGYLYSELEIFHEIKARYDALTSETDKINVVRLYGETVWDTWVEFDADVYALLAKTDLINSLHFNTFTAPQASAKKDYEGLDVFTTTVEWIFKIKLGVFTGEENDGQGTGVMDFDGSAYPSIYLTPFIVYLESVEGFTFPGFILDQLDVIGYDSFYNELWYPITNNILLGQKIMNGYEITDLTQDEIDFLNEVWTSGYVLGGQISWNWISGAKFATYFQARMTRIVLHVGADTKYVVSDYIDAIANWLAGYGYEINPNGWGTTADVIDTTPDASEAAQAIVARIAALTDLNGYTYKGWTTEDANISGYLYSEILEYRSIAAAYAELTGNEKLYVGSNMNSALYAAWGSVSNQFLAVENSSAWNKTLTGYNSDKQAVEYTSAEALHEILKAIATLDSGKPIPGAGDWDWQWVGTLNNEDSFFSAAWIAMFMDHFDGVTLPTMITEKLEKYNYYDFYNQTYYPLVYAIKFGEILADGTITKVEDLNDEQFEYLNTYWTNSFELKGVMAQHWPLEKFEKWSSNRAARLVLVAGGTLTGEGGAALKMYEYVEFVANFLTACNYTVKENGWGVTADRILDVSLTADVIAFADKFNSSLSDINNYKYVGWEAPEETAIAGYLYSEAKYFEATIVPMYEALTENEQKAVESVLGGAYETWTTLAAELKALAADEAFAALTFYAPNLAWKEAGTVNGYEALGQMINGIRLIAAGTKWGAEGWENDDGNGGGVKMMNSDNHWMPSFRVIYFMISFERAGVTLPTFIQEGLASITDANAEALISDVRYIYNVLTIAKMLEDNAELTLTDEIKDMVNDTMVGMTEFKEGGVKWNWNSGAREGDFGYRSPNYKLFFGLSNDNSFKYYLDKVVEFLVANGATASGLGIAEAL